MRPKTRWLLLAVVALGVTAATSAAPMYSTSTGTSHDQLPLVSDSVNLNASPTGHILFGAPLPVAEILPTANGSPAATLGLNHLLEIAPNASDPEHPTVVAEAAPEALAGFNQTISYDGTPKYYNIIATLPVFPADTALWVSGTTVEPSSQTSQQAILDVNYSVAVGPDGSPGVRISWTVSGWPWADPYQDDLALEYVVQVNAGSGFETCSGTPSPDAPDAACATEPLSIGQAVWSSAFTGLKGSGPSGSVAWISWGTQVAGSDSEVAPVSAGAYFEQPGTSALVVAAPAPAGGAASVSGSTLFLLSPGSVAAVVAPLVGDLVAYGGAAAVFGAAAGIGVFIARRRDQEIARDLEA
jgi:hypothetical protein